MSCLECGDVCSCGRDEVRISSRADFPHSSLEGRALVDPEALDMSEQQFEDSLAVYGEAPRFVVVEESVEVPVEPRVDAAESPAGAEGAGPHLPQMSLAVEEPQPEAPPPDEWRHEVAARLQRFRERRRLAGPRYPSLQLPFELPESGESSLLTMNESASRSSLALDPAPEAEPAMSVVPEPAENAPPAAEPGKLIEFPRYVAIPMFPEELAEPAFVPPRILEAPEMAPPQPALGGIILEAREDAAVPAQEQVPVASLARRILAAFVDVLLVAVATILFGWIAIRVAGVVPPLAELAALGTGAFAILWIGYQYMLLVHSGTTPGLLLAGLELRGPNGLPTMRRLRRWRVLSSVLSLGALGLGYAWVWFDEERLCWHDRITRTCMQRTVAGERLVR